MLKTFEKSKIFSFIFLFTLMCAIPVQAEVFYDFDNLPPTASDEIPGSGGGLLYTSATTNPDSSYPMTTVNWSGWRNTAGYPFPNTNVSDFFHIFSNGANSTHMGFEAYGYLEIDAVTAIKGNSLRYVITGGKNSSTMPGDNGLSLHTKEEYLNYLSDSQNPVEGNMKVGVPYVYFQNTSSQNNPASFWQAQNANRLSLYVKAPSGMTNGAGGNGSPPGQTMHIGPYSKVPKNTVFPNGDPNSRMGGHWYHQVYTQGGGWTHVLVDSHPQHSNTLSNSSSYPYPSSSLREIGNGYFDDMWRLYVTALPYNGIETPAFSYWIDEMEFLNDPEPQNNETINSPSVMYLPGQKRFEIGFNDKYKNNANSYSTYEVRYSFSQITNANWNGATPVHVQADSRFGIAPSTNGVFKKWWPYYQAVWAPFKLAPADEVNLTSGTTVYFAIKDVSQENGNGQNPVGGDNKAGRRYAEFPGNFDYAGDKNALNFIKRIDFYIANSTNTSQPPSSTDTSAPSPPQNLTITMGQ